MFRRICALLCLVTFPASGCHSYRLAEPGEAVAGTDVRIRVTPAEAGRLSEQALLRERAITGRLVNDADDGTLLLETRVPNTAERIYQRLDIPRTEVIELEVRETDGVKTTLLVGVLAVAVGTAAAVAFTGGDKGGGEDPPDPDNARIPLLQIRF